MRIVVVSPSGSLRTRINLAQPTWDVEHLTEPGDTRWLDGSDAIVVDARSNPTLDAAAIAALGERCDRVVVIGDRGEMPEEVAVLVPPFDLQELIEALGGTRAAQPPPEEAPIPRHRWFARPGRTGAKVDGHAPAEVARTDDVAPRGVGGAIADDQDGVTVRPEPAPEPRPSQRQGTRQVAQVRVAAVAGTPPTSPLLDEAPLRPRQDPPAPMAARPMSAQRFSERVERALLAVDEIHSLIGEVPTLGDLEAIGTAILEEIKTEVLATTISVLARGDSGFVVIEGAGLAVADIGTVIPLEHPFLRALAEREHAAYFERRGDGAAIVAGVPGATTPYLAVAPLRRRGTTIGLLLVGADTIDRAVTKILDRVAREAEPALALAIAIHSLVGAG